MKAIILLLMAVTVSITVIGQDATGKYTTSGKIIYQDKMKLDIKLEGDAAQFAESLPKEKVTEKVLLFNSESSLYRTDESNTGSDPMSSHNSGVTVKMYTSGGNDKTFSDIRNNRKIEQKEFMTRMFLVESEQSASDWRLTGNFRIVAGYNCQEAVREVKEQKISAWFSPSIPVSGGPGAYGGLPGLVLMVDIDNGKHTITATSIDPAFDVTGLIVRPKEGKKITSEEYKKMVEDKMKEMGGEGGSGGSHVIIRIKS